MRARPLEAGLDGRGEGEREGAAAGDATWFDLMTAAAFVAFRAQGVDWAVVEVGLGGRLGALAAHRALCRRVAGRGRKRDQEDGGEDERRASRGTHGWLSWPAGEATSRFTPIRVSRMASGKNAVSRRMQATNAGMIVGARLRRSNLMCMK